MHCLSIGSFASLVFLVIASVSAIAAEQRSDLSASSGLPGYAHQCSVTSKTNIDDNILADASERKSCESQCAQVSSMCKTSRARDCRPRIQHLFLDMRLCEAITITSI